MIKKTIRKNSQNNHLTIKIYFLGILIYKKDVEMSIVYRLGIRPL